MVDQQLGYGRVPDVQERVPQLGVRRAQVAFLEQDPNLDGIPDRVTERVRVAHGRAALEQQLQARRVVGLDGVVDGLAVVGVGPAVEQQPRRVEVVGLAGGAVEDRHRAVVVVVHLVDVGPAVQQQLDGPPHAGRSRRRRAQEDRMAGTGERPPPHAVHVAVDQLRIGVERRGDGGGVAEHERHVEARAGQRRVVREQALGDVGAASQRHAHEPQTALAAVAARRLHVADERRPGREAQCAGDGMLGVCQPRARSSRSCAFPPRAARSSSLALRRAWSRSMSINDHLRRRWCSQPVRPRSIASGSPGGPATGDGPLVLPASQARSPGRAR